MTRTTRRRPTAEALSASARTERWALLIAGPSVVGALWLVSLVTGHTCPWRGVTGISCPLCGGTRATWALATGRVAEAATLNLIAPMALVLAAVHAAVWATEAVTARRLVADRVWGRLWLWTAAAFLAAWLVKLVALAWLDLADPALH